eukprot:jgi/Bigna1/69201/fgenesh1_pg.8_\
MSRIVHNRMSYYLYQEIGKKLALALPEDPIQATIDFLESIPDDKYTEKCQLNEEWIPLKLISSREYNHNCKVLRFELPRPILPLNLPTCACILVKGDKELKKEVRPYTPISSGRQKGYLELLVKSYPEGKISKWMCSLAVGKAVTFKHIPFNVKIPVKELRELNSLIMLAGGTGITPMYQALMELLDNRLGSTMKCPKIVLLYGNNTEEDILLKEQLDEMQQRCANFRAVYVVSKLEEKGSAEEGFIDAEKIRRLCPPPSKSQKVLVCGPPPMYKALCGARSEKIITGVLKDLGYCTSENSVYKF